MYSSSARRGTVDDAALVDRMARGDAGALGELYDAHGAPAFALAYAVAGSRERAEAAAAAGFADAWQGAAAFRAERTSVRGWLFSLVRRHALTERVITRPVVRDDATANRATNVMSVDADRDDDRAAVELAYHGGLSVREIALALEQSEATVLRRLRSGMQTIRTSQRSSASDSSVPRAVSRA